MVKLAEEIWRDFSTDGVPSTPPHEPRKPDIRAWGAHLEYLSVAITTAGGKIYATKSAMDGDLVPGDNTPAIILSDSTPANNGMFRKFLARLSEEDLDTLEDGVKLVNAMRRVGRVMRWVIVGIAGIFLGAVLLWEAVLKVIGHLRAP